MVVPAWFLIPLFLVIYVNFRRRAWRGRWERDWYRARRDGMPPMNPQNDEPSEQIRRRDEQIELLESRVNELESRLDYTERLLMQRRNPDPAPAA
jgi:hypothetical protein